MPTYRQRDSQRKRASLDMHRSVLAAVSNSVSFWWGRVYISGELHYVAAVYSSDSVLLPREFEREMINLYRSSAEDMFGTTLPTISDTRVVSDLKKVITFWE